MDSAKTTRKSHSVSRTAEEVSVRHERPQSQSFAKKTNEWVNWPRWIGRQARLFFECVDPKQSDFGRGPWGTGAPCRTLD